MTSRKVTDCVYVDFKRAFDVASHQKLLTKLIAYGIDGQLLEWISIISVEQTAVCVCKLHLIYAMRCK